MKAKLTTRNINLKRWWVRLERIYQANTCRMNYKRLSARNSAIWSGQIARGCAQPEFNS